MILFKDIFSGQTVCQKPHAVVRLNSRHGKGVAVYSHHLQPLRKYLRGQGKRPARLGHQKFVAKLLKRITAI